MSAREISADNRKRTEGGLRGGEGRGGDGRRAGKGQSLKDTAGNGEG